MVNYQTYPNFYQPYFPQQMQQPPAPQMPTVNNPIFAWVQSEEEAINYPLVTGQSAFLMNQKEPYLYAKSVDQLGKPIFIKNRLVDETKPQDNKDSDFIRREEFEELINDRIQKEVERRVSQISFKPTRKKNVIVEEEED